jgi:hypothetical protein
MDSRTAAADPQTIGRFKIRKRALKTLIEVGSRFDSGMALLRHIMLSAFILTAILLKRLLSYPRINVGL